MEGLLADKWPSMQSNARCSTSDHNWSMRSCVLEPKPSGCAIVRLSLKSCAFTRLAKVTTVPRQDRNRCKA
eukprot:5593888-Amphidinium_carterae.2